MDKESDYLDDGRQGSNIALAAGIPNTGQWIEKLENKLKNDEEISLADGRAIFGRWAIDADYVNEVRENFSENSYDYSSVLWSYRNHFRVDEREVKLYWKSLNRKSFKKETDLVVELIKKMKMDDRFELVAGLLEGDDEGGIPIYTDEGVRLAENRILFEGLDISGPKAVGVGKILARRFFEDKKMVDDPEIGADYVFSNLGYGTYEGDLVEAMTDLMVLGGVVECGFEEGKPLLRELSRRFGIPEVLNSLRRIVANNDISEAQRGGATEVLRRMMGLGDGLPIYDNLGDLYNNIDFSKYFVSEATVPIRRRFLEKFFEDHPMPKEAKFLDVGAGTGWLMKMLKDEFGFENVTGIELSAHNIEQARAADPTLRMIEANWNTMDIPDESMDMVVCLGRSITHAETDWEHESVIRKMYRMVKPGGFLVYDSANLEVGGLVDYRDKTRKCLIDLGYSDDEVKNFHYVIDTPDGINFYNRNLMPEEDQIQRLKFMGGVVTIIREEIPNGRGDENIVFVVQKPENREQDYPRKLEYQRYFG